MFDIIAIHGVGDRKTGDVLNAVTRGLSHQASIRSDELWKSYNGHQFRYSNVVGHPSVASILEVNWDDISHPARSPIQLVTHFFSLVAAMLRVAAEPVEGETKSYRWTVVYQWIFMALLVWCVFLPIATIAGFIASGFFTVIWLAGSIGLVALLTFLVAPCGSAFRFGYVWALAAAILGFLSLAGDANRDLALATATIIYGSVQGLAGLALMGAVFEIWLRTRQARKEQRLARLACLYLPFALFSGIGAIVWVAVLAIGQQAFPADLTNWGKVYLDNVFYDLAFMEAVLALGVALGGILFLLPSWALVRGDGARVHARLLTALKYFPVIVIAVFALYLLHMPWFFEGGQNAAFNEFIRPWLYRLLTLLHVGPLTDEGPEIIAVYAASSLRLLPFVAYLFGPFRKISDTVGDVLLYLDPSGKVDDEPVKAATRKRLRDALDIVSGEGGDNTIMLLAHSQGSVIAADVLHEYDGRDKVFLVTMGSPISSLYWRFIGSKSVAAPKVQWLNLFRAGDYIAGGKGIHAKWTVQFDAKDRDIGQGGHGEYFEDKNVWKAIEAHINDPGVEVKVETRPRKTKELQV